MTILAPIAASLALFTAAPNPKTGGDDDKTAKAANVAAQAADEAAANGATPIDASQLEGEHIDPMVAAVLSKLSNDEVRATFLGMGEDQLQALMAKGGSGAALSGSDKEIFEAIQLAVSEQFDAQLNYQSGDVPIGSGLATLHLGEDFRYVSPEQVEKILVEAWGNPPGQNDTLGMIVPMNISPAHPKGWGVVITYSEDGHVEDDDAEDIDYDDLLKEMKEGTEEANKSRTAQGYAALHLVGWAEPPHYDKDSHRLYWAQELSSDDAPQNSLNYAIRVLGRKGVLELNAISGMSQIAQIKPEMEKILSKVEFDTGNRYEDFDPDIDKVAAYGIGGLIAGKLAMKAGLWAVIVKFFLAAKKLIIIGVIALIAGIKGLLGMKKKSDAPEE